MHFLIAPLLWMAARGAAAAAPLSGWLIRIKKEKAFTIKGQRKFFCVLRPGSANGVARLEYYEEEQTGDSKARPKGCIPLKDCTSCDALCTYKKFHSGVFEIVTPEKSYIFAAATDAEMDAWVEQICAIAFGQGMKDNIVYGTTEELVYEAMVKPTSHSQQLGIAGTVMICITPSDLILKRDDRVLGIWPLRYLRKYGRDGDLFSIEAGRKCEHGPGVMEFVTSKSEDIFTHVERFVILIARKKGGATSDAASALAGMSLSSGGGSFDASADLPPLPPGKDEVAQPMYAEVKEPGAPPRPPGRPIGTVAHPQTGNLYGDLSAKPSSLSAASNAAAPLPPRSRNSQPSPQVSADNYERLPPGWSDAAARQSTPSSPPGTTVVAGSIYGPASRTKAS